MTEKIELELISRRRAFSLLGLTAALSFAVPATVLTVSDAEAQTQGSEDRQQGRQQGRDDRQEGRQEGRQDRRDGGDQSDSTGSSGSSGSGSSGSGSSGSGDSSSK